MTKQEFIKQRNLFEKRYKRNTYFFVIFFILFIYLYVSIVIIANSGEPVYLLIIIFGLSWLTNSIQFKQIKNSGLNCSSCNELLTGGSLSRKLSDVVVETSNCQICGGSAFDSL